MGFFALRENVSGNGNTANGNTSMLNNFSGAGNTAMGGISLQGNISGQGQVAIGQGALQYNTDTIATIGAITGGSGYTDGSYTNVVLVPTNHNYYATGGIQANITVTSGSVTSVTIVSGLGVRSSTVLGILASSAPAGLLTGSGFSVPVTSVNVSQYNTAVGRFAGRFNYLGSQNVFLGYQAGQNGTNQSGNVFIGYQAGLNETGSNKLIISNTSTATPLVVGNFDPAGGANGTFAINGALLINEYTPPTAASSGIKGQIQYDNDYIYICVATNTWKRVGISTW
jgi:hypothetical protein